MDVSGQQWGALSWGLAARLLAASAWPRRCRAQQRPAPAPAELSGARRAALGGARLLSQVPLVDPRSARDSWL